ncbi:MOSC domain-containing protein [bacterium]|nr:MOSC domain-containing protein [bacterium]
MKLDQINIYPIKSCSGIDLLEGEVQDRGFPLDRRWMLIDSKGIFISQRNSPRLSLIKIELKGDQLLVSYPGMDHLRIRIGVSESVLVKTQIWDDTVEAYWIGSEADDWFSQALNRTLKLVFMDDKISRPLAYEHLPQHKAFEVSFADAYPYLLTNQASLEDLNQRLEYPIGMDRFRSNLSVSGFDAFAEDHWKKIKIGDVEFQVVKPCARCQVTTIDQMTGKASKEPLKTLATYRKHKGKVLFGMNLIALTRGIIRTNDLVYILN